MEPAEAIATADWRQRVAELHLEAAGSGPEALAEFRRRRDELFRSHPASPLNDAQLETFSGLPHFPFDPGARVECELLPFAGDPRQVDADTGGPDGVISFSALGELSTPWGDLTLLWTEGYGGGLHLPFRDATAPAETYGGGRYLTDTIKATYGGGLELHKGSDGILLTLDFNYAYNPSCAYDSRWACPLAPLENRLEEPIRAGEMKFPDPS